MFLYPSLFTRVRGRVILRSSRLLNSKRSGQLTVGVGLGQQVVGLLLDGGDRVGAGREAQRRLLLTREPDQRLGELGGVASLLAVHAVPDGYGLLGALGVVLDRGLGVVRRLRREQLGAEEAGLH